MEELRAQTPAQLESQLRTLREERFWLRIQRSAGQLTQWHLAGRARRDIARVLTALREKRREAEPARAPSRSRPSERNARKAQRSAAQAQKGSAADSCATEAAAAATEAAAAAPAEREPA